MNLERLFKKYTEMSADGEKLNVDLKVSVMIDLCTKDLREHLEMKSESLTDESVKSEIMNYLERKRVNHESQVKAMEVDNVESPEAMSNYEYWEPGWEEWPSSEQEELTYMGKGANKGNGTGKSGGKGFNTFYNPLKGKGKGEYYQYPYSGKGDQGSKGNKGKGKGKGFQGQCYWCGEWGHSQNDCQWKDEYMNSLRAKGKGQGLEVHNV